MSQQVAKDKGNLTQRDRADLISFTTQTVINLSFDTHENLSPAIPKNLEHGLPNDSNFGLLLWHACRCMHTFSFGYYFVEWPTFHGLRFFSINGCLSLSFETAIRLARSIVRSYRPGGGPLCFECLLSFFSAWQA